MVRAITLATVASSWFLPDSGSQLTAIMRGSVARSAACRSATPKVLSSGALERASSAWRSSVRPGSPSPVFTSLRWSMASL